ncbi:GntR family transcriptional regulator [Pseudogracilibacillus sp. SO10305]|uniref:GntR family transcriptional regulator n=1 Tax=Pseudogracilibacillus sp. SO10305 TaxID=3098292 RepID=UPI00300DC4AD
MGVINIYPNKYVLQHLSIGKQLEKELRIRIISQHIQVGEILSENQIAKAYNVSRSPVREALRTLESERLLRLERMGVVILGMSEKDIEEVYDVRLMIESFVMKRLLERENNDALVKELRKIHEMMHVAIKFQDMDEFSLQDMNFHETIIRSIQHQQMTIVWEQLRPVMECLIILSMRYRGLTNYRDFERILTNHELIIDAIETKENTKVDLAFESNFNDVQNGVEDLWTNPEMLKEVREYVEEN